VVRKGGQSALSLYGGSMATREDVLSAVATLSANFPNQAAGFYPILTKSIAQAGMRSEQLSDAVQNLITNHPYQQFRAAELLNFDKTIPLYTYREVCALWQGGWDASEFIRETVEDVTYWVKRCDIAKWVHQTGTPRAKAKAAAIAKADRRKAEEEATAAGEREKHKMALRKAAAGIGIDIEKMTFEEVMEAMHKFHNTPEGVKIAEEIEVLARKIRR
jgi:hypothetical protein